MSLQDLIGKEFPPFEIPVERGKIREFANAIGDDNPIYTDPAYAATTEFKGIIAPPTFTATKAFYRSAANLSEMTGLDPHHRLHGEEEYEYFQPVKAGDVLTCRSKITEAYEKAGKRGGKDDLHRPRIHLLERAGGESGGFADHFGPHGRGGQELRNFLPRAETQSRRE